MSRDYVIVPEDEEPNWLAETLWYDRSDRRYTLHGPNACTPDEYYTSALAAEYEDALDHGGPAQIPGGLPDDIAEEIREASKIDKKRS